jgi:hypothetical protein
MRFEDFKTDPSWDEERINNYRSFHQEIWNEAEYEKYDVGIMPGDIVVDCGASIGIFARYALSRGASKVVSVEADSNVHEYLVRNTDGENVMALNEKVGGEFTIESIMSAGGLERIDFLKIDIEGWEFDLLSKVGDDTLEKVGKISMEVHLWGVFEKISDAQTAADSCLRLTSLLERLTESGFRISFERAHANTCLFMVYAKR